MPPVPLVAGVIVVAVAGVVIAIVSGQTWLVAWGLGNALLCLVAIVAVMRRRR